MGVLPQLSLAEWIVLALITEQPSHGFAIAAITSDSGELGRVWQVPRPIVYRAAGRLIDLGLVEVTETRPGERGPQRSIMAATAAGKAAVRGWLREPVAHVREVRSALLVKLALLDRRNETADALVDSQLAVFRPIYEALAARQQQEQDFSRVLAAFRTESVGSALRFLDEISALADVPSSKSAPTPQRS
ncbi:MAG: PadR family transcriptional regulator [Frankiales bacterium]|nr:PadR family transcriptional regulator [Frankiales bacterium]